MSSCRESFLEFQPVFGGQLGSPQDPNAQLGQGLPQPENQPASNYGTQDLSTGGLDARNVRMSFLWKVLLVLTVQSMATLAVMAAFLFLKEVKTFVWSSLWILSLPVAGFLFSALSLLCCRGLRRKAPWNLLVLAILTLSHSCMLSLRASFYTTDSILIALGISAVICLLAVLFSIKAPCNFTLYMVVLLVLLVLLLMAGLTLTYLPEFMMEFTFATMRSLFFTWFLVVETQLLLGNKLVAFSCEEYVLAALLLYVDIFLVFTDITRAVYAFGFVLKLLKILPLG
ncbi:protein lifeguard 1-like [Hemicordylus capensis]|uniref:protein lifeguard 1-like n=1 Tax=Hemicordylus capensis TaxID=884348 RepID=UPI0023035DAC|nr:protein lifeguard 1-like [Hemicordylus capensis]